MDFQRRERQARADAQRVLGDSHGLEDLQGGVFGLRRQDPVRETEVPEAVLQPLLVDHEIGDLRVLERGAHEPGRGVGEHGRNARRVCHAVPGEVLVDGDGHLLVEEAAPAARLVALAVPAAHKVLIDGVEQRHQLQQAEHAVGLGLVVDDDAKVVALGRSRD